ncbi:hypothetical protein C8R46DRAFT_1047178 [Mycena filopes]|nr:hypothetical protein C8R46DRAFT_1047178 [Mycena filopes]
MPNTAERHIRKCDVVTPGLRMAAISPVCENCGELNLEQLLQAPYHSTAGKYPNAGAHRAAIAEVQAHMFDAAKELNQLERPMKYPDLIVLGLSRTPFPASGEPTKDRSYAAHVGKVAVSRMPTAPSKPSLATRVRAAEGAASLLSSGARNDDSDHRLVAPSARNVGEGIREVEWERFGGAITLTLHPSHLAFPLPIPAPWSPALAPALCTRIHPIVHPFPALLMLISSSMVDVNGGVVGRCPRVLAVWGSVVERGDGGGGKEEECVALDENVVSSSYKQEAELNEELVIPSWTGRLRYLELNLIPSEHGHFQVSLPSLHHLAIVGSLPWTT